MPSSYTIRSLLLCKPHQVAARSPPSRLKSPGPCGRQLGSSEFSPRKSAQCKAPHWPSLLSVGRRSQTEGGQELQLRCHYYQFSFIDTILFLYFTNLSISSEDARADWYTIAVSLRPRNHTSAFQPPVVLWVPIFSTAICSFVGKCRWPLLLLQTPHIYSILNLSIMTACAYFTWWP